MSSGYEGGGGAEGGDMVARLTLPKSSRSIYSMVRDFCCLCLSVLGLLLVPLCSDYDYLPTLDHHMQHDARTTSIRMLSPIHHWSLSCWFGVLDVMGKYG